jgi:hypothetical protein
VASLDRVTGAGDHPRQCTNKHANARPTTGETRPTPGDPEERKMAAKVIKEMSVGLTEQIESALQVATEFQGMKPSQYGRQAILEKLVREGYLRHPAMQRYETPQAAE